MSKRFNNAESELVYLRAELVECRKSLSYLNAEIERYNANSVKLLEGIKVVLQLVESQANDEDLWFDAQTAPEAYLQIELRRLHAEIEGRLERLK